jgi:GNAT superfamily N-acetyltransferase
MRRSIVVASTESASMGVTDSEAVKCAFQRTIEFQRATLELVAPAVEPIDQGWVVREPKLPLVWSANHVRITEPVSFTEALELADAHLGDLPYRQLMIDHRATGRRLERSFAEHRWEVDREVVMQLQSEPDREVDVSAVIDADEEPVMELMRRWIGEDESIELTPSGLDQVVEFTRRVARARDARLLGVPGEHGNLAAITVLYSDGTVAQVEDVYTVPEERRRGYGRMLVTKAAEVARAGGHELVFIVADADGWPQRLYRQIGFQPIGQSWALHRGD